VVPKVVGLTLAKARTRIGKAHCKVGTVTRAYSSTARLGKVLAERPKPGTRLKNGAKVSLTVGKGPKRRR
jgi:beta-lactam-binding protein with PASTA domain